MENILWKKQTRKTKFFLPIGFSIYTSVCLCELVIPGVMKPQQKMRKEKVHKNERVLKKIMNIATWSKFEDL